MTSYCSIVVFFLNCLSIVEKGNIFQLLQPMTMTSCLTPLGVRQPVIVIGCNRHRGNIVYTISCNRRRGNIVYTTCNSKKLGGGDVRVW